MKYALMMSLAWSIAALGIVCGCAAEPLMQTDFGRPPLDDGWVGDPGHDSIDPQLGWQEGGPGAGHIGVREGSWRSPIWRRDGNRYMAINVLAKMDRPVVWNVDGYDAAGLEATADHYATLDPSIVGTTEPAEDGWRRYRMMVRPRHGTVASRWSIHGTRRDETRVAEVSVESVEDAAVLDWADRIYAELPPVEHEADRSHWQHLPRTLAKLKAGEPVRIVLLGDSIANDTGNSPLDLLLERAWGDSAITVINSVRGGTGCWFYQRDDRIKPYVLEFDPDLVVIAGISHRFDEKAMASVIEQVRGAGSNPPEFIVSTGAVSDDPRDPEAARKLLRYQLGREPTDKQIQRMVGFFDRVREMAAEREVAFFDVRDAWETYIAASGKPAPFYRRDSLHANTRGRAVLSRLWLQYLGPGSAPAN